MSPAGDQPGVDGRLQAPGESLEEEFLFHFQRGGDLLQRGRDEEARFHLEQAARLFPENDKCLNLLGLLAFRQGRLADALDIYQRLLAKHPGEPSLQVNLATVLAKAGRLEPARQLLEAVLAAEPGHQRARTVLEGLRQIETEATPLAGTPEPQAEATGPGWEPVSEWSAAEPGPASAEAAAARGRAGPFTVLGVGVQVRAEGFCARPERLGLLEGEGTLEPLVKRFAGRDTRHGFGRGGRRMHLVRQFAKAWLVPPPNGSLLVVELAAQHGFWREEAVAAFWCQGDWENGRFQLGDESYLHVLHLEAPAAVVLAGAGSPARFAVSASRPLRVAGRLVLGWQGELEPAVVEGLASGERNWIEFRGTGEVMLAASPRWR